MSLYKLELWFYQCISLLEELESKLSEKREGQGISMSEHFWFGFSLKNSGFMSCALCWA